MLNTEVHCKKDQAAKSVGAQNDRLQAAPRRRVPPPPPGPQPLSSSAAGGQRSRLTSGTANGPREPNGRRRVTLAPAGCGSQFSHTASVIWLCTNEAYLQDKRSSRGDSYPSQLSVLKQRITLGLEIPILMLQSSVSYKRGLYVQGFLWRRPFR